MSVIVCVGLVCVVLALILNTEKQQHYFSSGPDMQL